MATTLDEFIQSITASGLMDAEEIQSYLDALPMDCRPQTAEDLAREMYRAGRLTKFQALAIYQKKTRGLVVGNYVVLDKLGKGGMGAVYKAQHKRMKRIVALKMLPSSATKSSDSVKRFQREVEAAAKLSHPNIVTAYDADEARGVHFLVMEYVDGQDLHALVKAQGTLSVPRAVDYVVQAAGGLEYAHSQGIIHRDIKPHNLLLDKKGTVKILDMGLARIEEAVGGTDATANEGLTQSGQVMGTLDYMPPEQALDTSTVDVRADIYSLGCTLYYLLAGRPPYSGDTVGKKIVAHRENPIPSLRELRSDVPQQLDAVFQKMLAKRPEERQQSMTEVISQLQGCTWQPGVAAPSSFPPSSASYAETVAFQQEDTAPPAELPLSPLDELFASEPVQFTERLMAPSRRYGRRWTRQQKMVMAAVAGGTVTLLVVLGMVLALGGGRGAKDTGGVARETKIGVAKEGGSPAKPEGLQHEDEPAATASPPSSDPDRESARWVLRNGGTLQINSDGKAMEVKSLAELPSPPILVWECAFYGNSSIGDELVEHIQGLGGLGNLCLGGTRVTGRGLGGLQNAKNLKLLFLDGTQVNDAALEHLKGMTSLVRLELGKTAVGDAGLEHLSGLVALTSLGLSQTQVSGPGLKHLHGMKSLEGLALGATPLTDAGLEQLREMKSLRGLDLYYTQVTDAGLKHLAGLSNLTTLNLNGTQISDDGLAHLEALPLESLSVASTKMTCNAVAKLKRLKSLMIGDYQVTESGVIQLAGLPGLSVLLLRDGQVTDKSLEHLKPMQKLTELHLEETKVTAAGIAALKAALPNCKVTWEPPAGQSMGAAPQPAKPPATPAAATPPPAIAPFDATKAKHHQEAWAKHLGVPVEATNSVGTALILVPPGEFMMGSTPEQIAWAVEEGKKKTQVDPWYFDCVSWEAPQHRVEITKPFYFGAYEVTQAEYEQVVGGNPSESKVDVRQPVENVSWFAAVAFCNRLSERERIQPYYEIDGQTVSIVGGDGYRLPTEAEWEYACRAGTTTKWYFGDDGSILGDYAWHEGNSGDKPHKVGEKKPNPWGLYDLYGSTSEWGWDRWTAHNPYEAKSVKDPTGPSDGPSRVLRGWAFSSAPLYLRSAYRGGTVPTWFHRTSGFRLAKTCLNARTVESPAALAPAGLSPASPKEAVKELNPLRSDEKPQPNDAGADGKVARAPRTTGASRRAVELRANDWIGLPQCWSVTRQGIMGSTGPTGINFNTFLCTRKTYRNFELHCQARLIAGNSGIQFRSEYVDRGKFVLRGPQVEIGIENWGSLFGEKTSGWMKIAPPQLTQRIVKANAFNDMFVRCVGKHVTIKINDETTVDDDFPTIADEGVIGLQLLSGRTEVMFRGIRLKELDDTKP